MYLVNLQVPFICFSFFVFVPYEKVNYDFFLLSFLSKLIYMYRMDTGLSLVILVSDMLKISKAKVETQCFKKLAIVTNLCLYAGTRCLRLKCKDNRKPSKIHSSTRIIIC